MHGRGPNPAPRRRRPTPAVYQRRPLGVLAVVVAVVVVTAFAIRDGGGGPSSVREIVRAQREAQPVRFTIESSGDLLIHMAVWTRALALGGSDYDFAPLFDAIKPYVAGADLALCHEALDGVGVEAHGLLSVVPGAPQAGDRRALRARVRQPPRLPGAAGG
jgi:hypothetical protein